MKMFTQSKEERLEICLNRNILITRSLCFKVKTDQNMFCL